MTNVPFPDLGRLGEDLWWEIKSSVLVVLVLRCPLVVEGKMRDKLLYLNGEVRIGAQIWMRYQSACGMPLKPRAG